MPDTFIKIASVTVGSGGAATISFSSIPSTYTDLCLKLSSRANATGGPTWHDVNVTLNGSGTYSTRNLYGDGSTAGSFNDTTITVRIVSNTATSNTFGSAELYIPNYAGSNQKSASSDMVSENNGTQAYAGIAAQLFTSTAAITSITLTPTGSFNFMQYSTATLYGIKNS